LWGNLGGNNYNGISNYNALQLQLTKRYSNGLLFSVNYVYSHFLDDQDSSGWGNRGGTQFWQIGNDPKANYGNSNFDIPQAFKGYASYELPFGKGKRYASEANKLVDAAVGGWRVAGTFVTQSGNPFTIVASTNNSFSDCGNNCYWYVNRVGNPHAGASVPAGSPPGTIAFFNPAAYALPTPGTFGDNGRNTLSGPRLTVFNMSLAKNFRFGERVALELRSDWVNIFNHPSFAAPGYTLGGSNFGVINGATGGPNVNGGVTVAPRSGQLSARVTF